MWILGGHEVAEADDADRTAGAFEDRLTWRTRTASRRGPLGRPQCSALFPRDRRRSSHHSLVRVTASAGASGSSYGSEAPGTSWTACGAANGGAASWFWRRDG